MMAVIITALRREVPDALEELAQLGRTRWRRRADVAYFDHHAPNGPTEAINGRLEALRRIAPEIPKPHPLPNPLTAALRQHRPTDRCTRIRKSRFGLRGAQCLALGPQPGQLLLGCLEAGTALSGC